MAVSADHPLLPVANAIAALPAEQNPIKNPGARSRMPAHLQGHIASIAAHPGLAAIASGMSPSPGNGNGGGPSGQEGNLGIGQGMFKRLPNVRHNACGFAANIFAGAGTQTSKATPQVRFKPNRLIIPSNTLAGVQISNLLVGTKPQYAAASVENFDFFEEQSTGSLWDMDVCEIGQTVTVNVSSPGATTVYAALIGEALDGRNYPILRSPMKRIAGVSAAAVAAGAAYNFTITPQVRFKIRKLISDDVTAKYFIITSFTIGISPQLMSGDPVPLAAFTEIAQDVWLDCDEAYVGNVVTLSVTNIDAAAHAVAVSLLGDVDPRDLATYGY